MRISIEEVGGLIAQNPMVYFGPQSMNRKRLLRMGTIVKRIRQAIEPGEIGLGQYLCFALLVRIPAVFFSRGYDFLDHQYQYLDPAYHVGLGGSWFLYHDYIQGLRSWVYPLILAGVFKLIAWTGITEPQVMMTMTRLIHGLISLIPVAAFWTLVVRWMGWQGQRPLLLFFAANWILVYSGVQPTGPTFAVGVALTAVFLFHGPGRRWPFLSGLLLGLAFSCRFQDAFFGLGGNIGTVINNTGNSLCRYPSGFGNILDGHVLFTRHTLLDPLLAFPLAFPLSITV